MTFHVEKAEKLIMAIRDNKECRNTKIIVGGYVFNLNDSLWKKIGADMYASDIVEALPKIKNES